MMTSRPRRIMPFQAVTLSQWALAFSLVTSVGTLAQAATVGHARIASAYGEPLQIIVPLNNVSQLDSELLAVSLADTAAWQLAGLTPPVRLDSLRVTLHNDALPGRKNIIVTSTQPLEAQTVDVLLNLQTGASRRQVQVTLLVPQGTSATPSVQAARLAPPAAAPRASEMTVRVRQGDNLLGIARRNTLPDATDYQMVVAIWRANPQAFIQSNMNLVRAGAVLRMPSPDQVRAIDPRQAQQIYLEQADAFADYRSRMAAQVSASKPVGGDVQQRSGALTQAPVVAAPAKPPVADRLQLSSADTPEVLAEDTRTAEQHAIKEAELRLQALQANIDALSRAAAATASGSGPAAPTPEVSAASSSTALASAAPAVTPTPEETPSRMDAASTATQAAQSGEGTKAELPVTADQTVAPVVASDKKENLAVGGTLGGTSSAAPRAEDTNSTAPAPTYSDGESLPTRDTLGTESRGWFADNMLVIVTAGLALIVLIIAWLMRLAGSRRADESESEGGGDQGDIVFDEAVIARQLDEIDLDINKAPPSDSSERAPRG